MANAPEPSHSRKRHLNDLNASLEPTKKRRRLIENTSDTKQKSETTAMDRTLPEQQPPPPPEEVEWHVTFTQKPPEWCGPCKDEGKRVRPYNETSFCDECFTKYNAEYSPFGNSVSAAYVGTVHEYYVDEGGMIWGGMPDNPEPEISFMDLPVFKQHPNPKLFKKIAVEDLHTQLELSRLTWYTTRSKSYTCFICGKKHVHVVERKRRY